MHKFPLIAALMVTACAAVPPQSGSFPAGMPGQQCVAEPAQSYVGQEATATTGAAIVAATHSSILRWVAPGMMMTMEFSPDRVTVRYAPDRRITAIDCG